MGAPWSVGIRNQLINISHPLVVIIEQDKSKRLILVLDSRYNSEMWHFCKDQGRYICLLENFNEYLNHVLAKSGIGKAIKLARRS